MESLLTKNYLIIKNGDYLDFYYKNDITNGLVGDSINCCGGICLNNSEEYILNELASEFDCTVDDLTYDEDAKIIIDKFIR